MKFLTYAQGVDGFRATDRISASDKAKRMGRHGRADLRMDAAAVIRPRGVVGWATAPVPLRGQNHLHAVVHHRAIVPKPTIYCPKCLSKKLAISPKASLLSGVNGLM